MHYRRLHLEQPSASSKFFADMPIESHGFSTIEHKPQQDGRCRASEEVNGGLRVFSFDRSPVSEQNSSLLADIGTRRTHISKMYKETQDVDPKSSSEQQSDLNTS